MKTTRIWALLTWMLIAASSAQGAYVILTDGRRMDGSAIRARANGDIILTTERGDLTFTRGQYREAWADRPPAMDRARQQLQSGQFDHVISGLEGVVTEFRHLSWDLEALAMIGAAQSGKRDFSAAIASFDRLFTAAPARRDDANIKWTYYEALIGAEQFDRVEPILNDLIAKGERVDAARAQILRGDIKRQRGLSEAALLDYLRTVVLFKAESAVQAEAHFKAGEALEEMRDARAREMFRVVVEQHGNSPYAQRARAKL